MTILYIVTGIFAVALCIVTVFLFAAKKREHDAAARARAAENNLESERHRAESVEKAGREAGQQAAERLSEAAEKITVLSAELARQRAINENLTARIENDKKELEKVQESFRHEFRNLANEIMEQKSAQFKEVNREAMDAILKPFRNNISEFRERVEAIYSEENRQRGALQFEIKNLMDLNKRITEETTNLTRALKGSSKTQGDWGEMILDTILESSSLVNGVHYTTQQTMKNEEGANVRPDVILKLPEGKQIVIDSKVSLTAYVAHCESEDEAVRRQCLEDHLASVRRHVTELGSKNYQQLVDSPDFVIMFVPNEPAFLAAMQRDTSLWADAYNKKVIVSSPTNLFALLKIVDDLWKRDSQNRNAIEIAEEGAKLYDKFVGFVETLEQVGRGLRTTTDNYDRAMKQLIEGSGNLVGRTEKLRKLGIKASKTLPQKINGMVPDDGTGDE